MIINWIIQIGLLWKREWQQNFTKMLASVQQTYYYGDFLKDYIKKWQNQYFQEEGTEESKDKKE